MADAQLPKRQEGRVTGQCADPQGKCQFIGKTVQLYNGCCRPCYDRVRSSNPKNKETMIDLSSPAPTQEDKNLHKGRSMMFDAWRLMGVTEEDADIAMKTLGRYFRPIMSDLVREKTAVDILLKYIPPVTDAMESVALNASTDSTSQHPQQDSTVQQPQQAQPPQLGVNSTAVENGDEEGPQIHESNQEW